MTLDAILALCMTRTPTSEEMRSFCRAASLTVDDAVNSIALAVARRYALGSIDYATGDKAMNCLYSYAFLQENRLPSPMYEVYLAFDEGEYVHRGDSKDVEPEAKYTRPMIAKILQSHGKDAV